MDPTPDAPCPHCFAPDPGHPCRHCGWQRGLDNQAPGLPLGTRLHGTYRIGRVLGHGGFGITYLAWDENLELRLAIKEYLPLHLAGRDGDRATLSVRPGEAREQFDHGLTGFLNEARALARFDQHPGIVGVKGYLRAHGTGYMVMEYVPGITLKTYLERRGGRIPFADALALLMPVMDALRAVHQVDLLHRDIAPDNIYITTGGQVKLLDFGAARQALRDQSQSLSMIFKPGYAPWEQCHKGGRQGPWTDCYALAATLYHAITGQRPPESPDRMEQDELVAPSRLGIALPAAAEAVLMQALAVKAKDRIQDMVSLQWGLQQQAVVPPPLAVQPTPAPSAPTPAKPPAAPDLTPGDAPGATHAVKRRASPWIVPLSIVVVIGGLAGSALYQEWKERDRRDRSAFDRAVDQQTAAAYQDYLDQCAINGCARRIEAERRLAQRLAADGQAEQNARAAAAAQEAARAAEAERAAEAARAEQAAKAKRAADAARAAEEARLAQERAAQEAARSDKTPIPAMVAIPAGSFSMGCQPGEKECDDDEKPTHRVQVAAFELGQTEVTFNQWDACVTDGGCTQKPADQGWGRGKRPVINVSWDDAQQYLTWLGRKTGQTWRLPTEAEWEYAARAGTSTAFSTGNCITTAQANYDGNYDYADCGAKTGKYLQKTQPVGSYPANRWGLYDMHGNAWEWVQDCYHDSYTDAPKDGAEWRDSCHESGQRVLRGGSWSDLPRPVRSAYRLGYFTGLRNYVLGFRVARTLTP
ncbi:bifunctional serine/threonine-protein kinase/formylglycine-generating enzyme family protein [uncultured Thiodictyon sp.]|jgi:formylglycine-generating enzyme required for sulfatase activity/serine/threonine protein kinase|uniref:bifunctional serine/threonine-protein kinase/formylglycine-generating enzyme family protein n=1 Tax=uncultured Thiodictyon sp. TaxID=1846217 RepID=UPI0025FE39F5|nr:bifunctional serine/threonine-protein kinase/formylglycine-generating enzyme family protein [uncultured Thiodictyon sp.]